MTLRDPILHTHIEDGLPETHPLASVQVHCTDCGYLVHAGNNECMTTWVETGRGPFCIACFAGLTDGSVEDEYGLGWDTP